MSNTLIMKNIKTNQTEIFYNVSNLVAEKFDVKSFSAIFDLAQHNDVKVISFTHSKGIAQLPTAIWQPVTLKGY